MKQQSPTPILFVGPEQVVTEHVEKMLQAVFCSQNTGQNNTNTGCFCSECRKIKSRQHHGIIWISPEKNYTVDDIDIIFEKSKFALDDNQYCFFVLDKAQGLSGAVANRLLKILEEPPAGYRFMLLSNNATTVLPTILSRCHVMSLMSSEQEIGTNPLLLFFYNQEKRNDPFGFESELKKQHLSDSASLELLNSMLNFYSEKLAASYTADRASGDHNRVSELKIIIEFLHEKMRKPPQSGSSELFWKNMYLSFPVF